MEKRSCNKSKCKKYRKNDPLGSYTGVCEESNIPPVQDADDL
ncbi:MAG: hypothetical protein ACI4PF_05615 [Christensenellales bacterium]